MNKNIYLVSLLTICFGYIGCTSVTNSDDESIKREYVILFGIDGLSPIGIKEAYTPVLDSLILHGSWSMDARAVSPTISSPNWASILNGTIPELHGIQTNAWLPGGRTDTEVKSEFGFFPTIFYDFKKEKPSIKTAAIYHWKGFGNLIEEGIADISKHYPTSTQTVTAAASLYHTLKPNLLYVHIDQVDAALHRYGFMSSEYLDAVESADSDLGLLMFELKSLGINDEIVIMITSDHGGKDFGHGGDTKEEREVPFIISGAGIKQNYKISRIVFAQDIPVTISEILGFKAETYRTGYPIQEANLN